MRLYHGFHRVFYAFVRFLIRFYFLFSGYKYIKFKPKSKNYIVLTNHNTDWDFFYVGLILKKQMYFVTSEHIMRKGLASKMLNFLVAPIPRKKGSSSSDTTEEIIRRIRKGYNVCMMAEGNKSFSGLTGYISPKTANLVKQSGCGLITIALHGGYFISPRWSKNKRKGSVWADTAKEYTAEELAIMSDNQLYNSITKDLFVDAYKDQQLLPRRYTGKNLAENLETTLFYCPSCHSFSSMHSSKDTFFCDKCNLSVQYDEYGFFKPTAPFSTVTQWYSHQLDFLKKYLKTISEDSPIFHDTDISLSLITPNVKATAIFSGEITLYKTRLELKNQETTMLFNIQDITKISVAKRDILLFTHRDSYYEIKPVGKIFSALKYQSSVMLLSGKPFYI